MIIAGCISVCGLYAREYLSSDFSLLTLRSEDQKDIGKYPDLKERIATLCMKGPSLSIFTPDDQLVTIVGIVDHGNSLGEVWQIPNSGMPKKHIRLYLKAMSWLGERAFRMYGFSRLFTWCDNDDLHIRWMEYLGYTKLPAIHAQRGQQAVMFEKAVKYGRS